MTDARATGAMALVSKASQFLSVRHLQASCRNFNGAYHLSTNKTAGDNQLIHSSTPQKADTVHLSGHKPTQDIKPTGSPLFSDPLFLKSYDGPEGISNIYIYVKYS